MKGGTMAFIEYYQIMTDIRSSLTGNTDEDIMYLADMSRKYRSSEMSSEIIRGIGRIMQEILPDDTREEADAAILSKLLGWKNALAEADLFVRRKELVKAGKTIGSLITRIEEYGLFADDSFSEYKDFGETFEEVLYLYRRRPQKTLRTPGLPYAHIYTKYGFILYGTGDLDGAKDALFKAQKWNPISADISFGIAEVYRAAGDMDAFLSTTGSAYNNCFRPESLARYYRNLSLCFSEEKKYREAAVCLQMSSDFGCPSEIISTELFHLEEISGGEKPDLSAEQIRELLQKENIPVSASEEILDLSYTLARDRIEHESWNGAAYFLKIFCDLTGDEGAEMLLERVQQEIVR